MIVILFILSRVIVLNVMCRSYTCGKQRDCKCTDCKCSPNSLPTVQWVTSRIFFNLAVRFRIHFLNCLLHSKMTRPATCTLIPSQRLDWEGSFCILSTSEVAVDFATVLFLLTRKSTTHQDTFIPSLCGHFAPHTHSLLSQKIEGFFFSTLLHPADNTNAHTPGHTCLINTTHF